MSGNLSLSKTNLETSWLESNTAKYAGQIASMGAFPFSMARVAFGNSSVGNASTHPPTPAALTVWIHSEIVELASREPPLGAEGVCTGVVGAAEGSAKELTSAVCADWACNNWLGRRKWRR